MKRQTLDEYLDRQLDAAETSAIERELAADPSAARLMENLQAERAARAAAFASFAPSTQEAHALTARIMEACHDARNTPLARIGPWSRRLTAIAASLAILAGAFAFGRASAPQTASEIAQNTHTVYSVLYIDSSNDMQETVFNSAEERTAFVRDLEAHQSNTYLASLTRPGSF